MISVIMFLGYKRKSKTAVHECDKAPKAYCLFLMSFCFCSFCLSISCFDLFSMGVFLKRAQNSGENDFERRRAQLTWVDMTGAASPATAESSVLEWLAAESPDAGLMNDDVVVAVVLAIDEKDEAPLELRLLVEAGGARPMPCCCCTFDMRLKNSLYRVSTCNQPRLN